MALIKCPECGKEISDLADPCPYCGYSERKDRDKRFLKPLLERKSKYKAAVLAIFFFYLGAHEFYLGRIGRGIAWILSSLILGILLGLYSFVSLAVAALIEALFLICTYQEKFDYTFNCIKK